MYRLIDCPPELSKMTTTVETLEIRPKHYKIRVLRNSLLQPHHEEASTFRIVWQVPAQMLEEDAKQAIYQLSPFFWDKLEFSKFRLSQTRVGGDLWATKLFFLEFIVPNDFVKKAQKWWPLSYLCWPLSYLFFFVSKTHGSAEISVWGSSKVNINQNYVDLWAT